MVCGIKVRFVNTTGKNAVPRITAEGYIHIILNLLVSLLTHYVGVPILSKKTFRYLQYFQVHFRGMVL
jgi:hypothetical protein